MMYLGMHHRLKLKDPKMNNQLGCEIHWVSLMTHHLLVVLLFLRLKNAPYHMGYMGGPTCNGIYEERE